MRLKALIRLSWLGGMCRWCAFGSVSRLAQSPKYLPGRNNPSNTIVDGHAPGEPPSPSPSITRRRTPAALAVGVHPFQGTLQPAARCLLDFRDSYYARSGLFDHLNSNRFDYWSDRLFHFPRRFLHWRSFGLRPGNLSLCRLRSPGHATCLAAFSCEFPLRSFARVCNF
jgi:hypothetical protein